MATRITLRVIAEKTGYHYSTVSLALRNDAKIERETRAEIQRVAEEMGYVPDPLVRALAIYRASSRPASYHATLAWISNAEGSLRDPRYIFRGFGQGALHRATQLGYKLEEFSLDASGVTLANLPRILLSRGINGILVAPQGLGRSPTEIRMDWSRFPAVAFGYSLKWPRLHLVANYHHHAVKVCLQKLVERGHRRIGLIVNKWTNLRVDGNWMGGYFAGIDQPGLKPFVFPLSSRNHRIALAKKEAPQLKAWLKKNRLDALIIDYSPPLIDWLRSSCRLRIPEDISVVSLNVESDNSFASGIDQNDHELGTAAVDFLVNLIHTNERGIPSIARRILIEGTWSEGQTIQPK